MLIQLHIAAISTCGLMTFVAAQVLDSALLRPGRFDRQVTVDRPDISGRVQILKVHSRGKQIGKDVDFDKVARRTPGVSLGSFPLILAVCDLAQLIVYSVALVARPVFLGLYSLGRSSLYCRPLCTNVESCMAWCRLHWSGPAEPDE